MKRRIAALLVDATTAAAVAQAPAAPATTRIVLRAAHLFDPGDATLLPVFIDAHVHVAHDWAAGIYNSMLRFPTRRTRGRWPTASRPGSGRRHCICVGAGNLSLVAAVAVVAPAGVVRRRFLLQHMFALCRSLLPGSQGMAFIGHVVVAAGRRGVPAFVAMPRVDIGAHDSVPVAGVATLAIATLVGRAPRAAVFVATFAA